jgi:cell division protein FtsQ
MKRKSIIIWSIIGVYLIIVLIAVSINRNSVVCNRIEVNFSDTTSARLVDQKEIIDMLEQLDGKILGEKMSSVNLAILEDGLNNNPLIKTAELFKTIDGVLRVNVEQRIPVVRIYTDTSSYYLDKDESKIPLPRKYRPRVLVANGNVGKKAGTIDGIFAIAKFISDNEFWKAQIDQIYVNKKNEFELIPQVGAHLIYFGDTTDIETKFNKLMALYQYGFQTVDWNAYREINLKFRNQVVCVK